jgi:uncharacterized protein YlzI (FlbEa/FlbD family)
VRLVKFTAQHAGWPTSTTFELYVNPDHVEAVRMVVDTTSIRLASGLEYIVKEKAWEVVEDLKSL